MNTDKHRLRQTWWFLRVALALAVAGWGSASAQTLPAELRGFLEHYGAANDSELRRLQAGQPVAKLLETTERREVAVFGMIQINVPAEFFVEQFRDIVRFKESPMVPQIGKFSDPPRPEDLGRLTMEESDLEALTHCRAGDCPVKASAEIMERFRREAAASPVSKERGNSAVRKILAEYARDYAEHGNSALLAYRDKKQPVRLQEEFLSLLAESSYLPEYAPRLLDNLIKFPRAGSPEVKSFLYWSKESYGLKPVVSITHAIIYPTEREGRPWCFLASKQIYASHYYEASLGLTIVVEETTEPSRPRISVLYLNRTRVDALRGWFVTLKRYFLAGRIRSGMEQNLRLVKNRLETRYRQRAD